MLQAGEGDGVHMSHCVLVVDDDREIVKAISLLWKEKGIPF